MPDGFTVSDALCDEVESEVFEAPVDAENPGFASLRTVLRQAQAGVLAPGVAEAYLEGLRPRVDEARAQIDLFGRLLPQLPAAGRDQASAALAVTASSVDRLEHVLSLLGEYLANGDRRSLEEGIALLDSVQQFVRTM